MSKEMLVIALGLFTVVVTQLGIPSSWKMLIVAATGLSIASVGFLLRGESLSRSADPHGTSYLESRPRHADEEKNGITSLN